MYKITKASSMTDFSDQIKHFIKDTPAKTWPHEYIVQEKVDNDLFLQLSHHIDTFGYEKYFYKKKMTYFDYDGYVYWHMENIINRCDASETFWAREKEGRLPE